VNDAAQLKEIWKKDTRWRGVLRPYSAEEVIKLRGSVLIEYTLAKRGAKKLWDYLSADEFLPALGAITGTQAVQQVTAGLKAIYCSGWQVAGDNNSAFETYPDQSLYPVDSVPNLVKRINKAFQRTDQITSRNGQNKKD
jgi:isocitrate lyase